MRRTKDGGKMAGHGGKEGKWKGENEDDRTGHSERGRAAAAL